VLLARRGRMRPIRRSWGRTILIFGSPIAAAASIVIVLIFARPAPVKLPHVVAASQETLSPDLRKKIATRDLTAEETDRMNAMAISPAAGIVEGLLVPVVEKTKN